MRMAGGQEVCFASLHSFRTELADSMVTLGEPRDGYRYQAMSTLPAGYILQDPVIIAVIPACSLACSTLHGIAV